MNTLEDRLRRDAEAIDSRAPADTVRRAQAAIRTQAAGHPETARPRFAPWWLVGLASAGVAAAVLLMVRPQTLPDRAPLAASATPSPTLLTIPAVVTPPPMLQLDTVARTAPLDAELERLQSDLERARETIQDDIRTMF